MSNQISNKLKNINNTSYEFNNEQIYFFNYIMSGYNLTEISKELNISQYKTKKYVDEIKNITGINNDDLKYLQNKKKIKENKLEKEEINYKKLVGELIGLRYLGYTSTKDLPKIMYIRISQLAKKYNYHVIYETLLNNKSSLDRAFTIKKFVDINHKLNYILVVINSNINIINEKIKNNKLIQQSQNSKNSDLAIMNNMEKNIISHPTKRKDFSNFLDEE